VVGGRKWWSRFVDLLLLLSSGKKVGFDWVFDFPLDVATRICNLLKDGWGG
ncbi:hypothetical protein A2U01_0093802, partial [Trifolium medium]|nr:hypothetical protein [Trifolium medium]